MDTTNYLPSLFSYADLETRDDTELVHVPTPLSLWQEGPWVKQTMDESNIGYNVTYTAKIISPPNCNQRLFKK
eukprot:Pgem_evm1s6232